MEIFSSTFITKRDIKEDYLVGKELGVGQYSTVYECHHKKSGNDYAVKIIPKRKVLECHQIANEIEVLKLADHSNIIRLYEVFANDDFLYIVLELLRGGNLFTEVVDEGPFEEPNVYIMFSQIFDGVRYLHSQNIVHRDLKLENILISRCGEFKLKLSDFGLSKLLPSNEEIMKSSCGTPAYVAPEVLLGCGYTAAVDVWSLGVILFTLVFAEYPFHATSLPEIYEKILAGKFEFPAEVSEDLGNLMQGMMKTESCERLTMDEISEHPWMKQRTVQASNHS